MRLLRLLDDYGVVELTAAVTEAINRQAPHSNSVHYILEQDVNNDRSYLWLN